MNKYFNKTALLDHRRIRVAVTVETLKYLTGNKAMQSNSKRRFVDAYLNEVGDLRNTVNRSQLYEIAIAAGKDLLISDLGSAGDCQFDKAYEIFEQLPVTNFLEIMELYNNCLDEVEPYQQFILVEELAEVLNEDEELDTDEIRPVLEFLESFASHGRIDCRKLFDEFEKSRGRLLDAVAQKVTDKQATISRLTRFGYSQYKLSENDQPSDRSYKNTVYLILYNTVEKEVVTVTMHVVQNKYISEKCSLKPGEYIVSIQTLNCMMCSNVTSANDEMKLVDLDGKLTKHFKMTLMNMFDLFDFDENGKLSREEFDIYNLLASDEHVLDQEWDILCRNFGAKNGELLLTSFVALHQVEADNDPSLEDTWMTLLCVGYNKQLDLINVKFQFSLYFATPQQKLIAHLINMPRICNCPCSFTIISESTIYMRQIELREPTGSENEALADYFWKNGQEVASDVDVRIWKCDYFAVCIAGPMKLPYAMNLEYGNSRNVLVKELIDLQRIPLKFITPKILLSAIATESDWSLILTVETTI
uniref:EF-hand domain-containing protein n=1 Tax=Setaria digitata TaxID=48799 RepID=A0A915PU25_9BILA